MKQLAASKTMEGLEKYDNGKGKCTKLHIVLATPTPAHMHKHKHTDTHTHIYATFYQFNLTICDRKYAAGQFLLQKINLSQYKVIKRHKMYVSL